MIRQWKIAVVAGWTGILVLTALALTIGLVLGLALASQSTP